MAGVQAANLDPLGWSAYMVVNRAAPPFDNPALVRALLGAVDQTEFMQAVVGYQPGLSRTGVGVFNPVSPLANDAGMEALTGPRDLDRVRALVRDSGYAGQPVVLLSPADRPQNVAMAAVAQQMMQQVGLRVDLQSMDFGTTLARVNSRGGAPWGAFCARYPGISTVDPADHGPLLGRGPDPVMEALVDTWFDAPDMEAQLAVARAIQLRAFEDPPMLPLGQLTAFRYSITGILPGPTQLFWNLRKA